MLVLGISGTFGAGKGLFVELVKQNFNCSYASLSDILRSELDKRGLERTRDNLRNLGNELSLKYGKDFLAQKILKQILPSDLVVIDSIRKPEEIQFLKNKFHEAFHAVWIDADIKIRFNRIKSRKREGEENLSFEEFKLSEEKESDKSNAQNLRGCKLECGVFLVNNLSKEAFKKKVLELLSSFGIKPK